MSTDLLRAYANERIDLVDFDFLADSGFQDNLHQPNAQFFTDPGGQRSWILDGFEITNVGGTKQVVVTKGRAILARREGAIVHYGTLTVEGDATKIIDMATLTPNAGYGLYLRFEYVDGDTGSRVFWNPAGSGSEVAQSVATRRKANWSIRTELSSPGAEWLRIATVSNIPTPVGITDERPLYFEGEVHNSYQSGWSSDGGGIANDRNADRQQYGVKDLQGFTAAMRQCLEDIKGRGLRRWWARDIGGMNIGFDAAPVEDKLQVGSVDTFVDGGAAKLIQADTDVYLDGANHELYVESDVFLDGTDRRLELDTDVYFDADGAGEAKLSLASDAYWDATLTNRILQLAPNSYWIHFNTSSTSTLYMGASAYIGYAGSSDYFSISPAGGSSAQFSDDGVNIYLNNGLVVGDNEATITPLGNDILVTRGGINVGGTTDPDAGDIITDGGIMVGADLNTYTNDVNIAGGLHVGFTDTDPADDEIKVGDVDFGLDFFSATDVRLYASSTDYLKFDRTDDIWSWQSSTIIYMSEEYGEGLRVRDGLYVGDALTPILFSNDAVIRGGIAVGSTTNPDLGEGIFEKGIVVGAEGSIAVDKGITFADEDCYVYRSTGDDDLQFVRTTASTTVPTDKFVFRAHCTGDMAEGFGGDLEFRYTDSLTRSAMEIQWRRWDNDSRAIINFNMMRYGELTHHTVLHHKYDVPVFGRYIDTSLDYDRSANDIVSFVCASNGTALTQTHVDNAYLAHFMFMDPFASGFSMSLNGQKTQNGLCCAYQGTGRVFFVHGAADDDIEFHSNALNGTTYQQMTYDASENFWYIGDGGASTTVVPGGGGLSVRVFAGSVDTDCALIAWRSTTTATHHVFQVHSSVGGAGTNHFNVEAGGDCRNTGGNYLAISDESTKDFIGDFYASPSPLLPYDLGRVFATIKPIHFGSKLLDHKKAELFGFRGAQVQSVLPSLATRRGDDQLLSVNLTGMIPVLWEAVRQIMDKLDMLGNPV